MTEIVAVHIGGTHARFAIAEVDAGRVVALGEACTMKTAEHASLQTAGEAFAAELGRPLPAAAGIAMAGPVEGDVLKLTNNPWVIRPALIPEKLGAERFRWSTTSARSRMPWRSLKTATSRIFAGRIGGSAMPM